MEKFVEEYLSFYKKIVPEFTRKELEFIMPKLSFKTLNKNEVYLEQGKLQKSLGFVAKGLLRQFYINDEGNNITVDFSPENTFTTDYAAFVKQSSSNYSIVAIENTLIIELPFEDIQEGYMKYKNYERFGRLISEKILIRRQKRIESFLFSSAEERYLNFINENSSLFNRISLTQLSTFLGIKRQSLSRIRNKLVK